MDFKTKLTHQGFLKVIGYLFLVMVAATALTFVYYRAISMRFQEKTAHVNLTPKRVKTPQTGIATVVDPVSGLSFEHAKDLEKIQPTSSIYSYRFYMKEGEVLSALAVSGNKYKGTNLGLAYAVVAVRENARESDCEKYWDGKQAHSLTEEYQGKNEKFMYGEEVGAAAGTRHETRIFHVYRARTCYEINLNLSESNIQNYPPGKIKPFDQESVWATLAHIVNSFKLKDEDARVKPSGSFCGGIAAKSCPSGHTCAYEGDYPDAGGMCVKKPVKSGACIQVITKAVNPDDGKTYTFPTPCEVPGTWKISR